MYKRLETLCRIALLLAVTGTAAEVLTCAQTRRTRQIPPDTPDDVRRQVERLRSNGSSLARFAVDCNRKVRDLYKELLGQPVMALPDAIAMAMAIDPGLCRTESLYVTVETTSELTRGETVVDRWGVLGQPPNVQVCFDPAPARFKRLLFDTLT